MMGYDPPAGAEMKVAKQCHEIAKTMGRISNDLKSRIPYGDTIQTSHTIEGGGVMTDYVFAALVKVPADSYLDAKSILAQALIPITDEYDITDWAAVSCKGEAIEMIIAGGKPT